MNKALNPVVGVYITDSRRSGNTTRIVDRAINLLFEGYSVFMWDHNKADGTFCDAHMRRLLAKRIMKRLSTEHPHTKFDYNVRDMVIKLVP